MFAWSNFYVQIFSLVKSISNITRYLFILWFIFPIITFLYFVKYLILKPKTFKINQPLLWHPVRLKMLAIFNLFGGGGEWKVNLVTKSASHEEFEKSSIKS